jgi:hypothetical protein
MDRVHFTMGIFWVVVAIAYVLLSVSVISSFLDPSVPPLPRVRLGISPEGYSPYIRNTCIPNTSQALNG